MFQLLGLIRLNHQNSQNCFTFPSDLRETAEITILYQHITGIDLIASEVSVSERAEQALPD